MTSSARPYCDFPMWPGGLLCERELGHPMTATEAHWGPRGPVVQWTYTACWAEVNAAGDRCLLPQGHDLGKHEKGSQPSDGAA